jgi:hypothetical protein
MHTRRAPALAAVLALTIVGGAGCKDLPDDPPPPLSRIDLSGGGGGSTRWGGDGGSWDIEVFSPGGVKLLRSGAADTSFAVPRTAAIPVDLGSNGVIVTGDVQVVRLSPGAAHPEDGVLYVFAVAPLDPAAPLYRRNSTSGALGNSSEQVTGMSIRPGATLTLALNLDTNGNGGDDLAVVWLPKDLEIAGTLRVAPLTSATGNVDLRHGATALRRDSGGLSMKARRIFVRPGGTIDLRGGDGATGMDARGGDGGYIRLQAVASIVNEGTVDNSGGAGSGTGRGGDAGISSAFEEFLALYAEGANGSGAEGLLVNHGRIVSNGGAGSSGGLPSLVRLRGRQGLYHSGEIAASGGEGRTGDGGGGVRWRADYTVVLASGGGSVHSSGAITARGGGGATVGGRGGYVSLRGGNAWHQEYDTAGHVVSSSEIDVSGGAGAGGHGGEGGLIVLDARGSLRSSGALRLDGGAAAGGNGGHGGTAVLQTSGPAFTNRDVPEQVLPVGPLQLSGSISARGGSASGGQGGDGGDLAVYLEGNHHTTAAIELLGYASAALSGGEGTDRGGDAQGPLSFASGSCASLCPPAGGIQNELDLSLRAGDATAAGGEGGWGTWSLFMRVDPSFPSGGAVRNSGNLDLSGGRSRGTKDGGHSGGMWLSAPGGVTNTGRILNRGGDAEAGTGGIGNWYEIWLVSAGDVVNAGEIVSTGGAGASGGAGSDGPAYSTGLFAGGQVRNSGRLDSRGGLATDAAAGRSGDGGHIELWSLGARTIDTGGLLVAPGTGGATSGAMGEISIDGVNVTPPSGTR